MKIKCFGIARDIVGSSELQLDSPVSTVLELRAALADTYPETKNLQHWMVAVNQSYADDTVALTATDEIALIPPVSGG